LIEPQTSLEMPARGKRSSLLRTFTSYGCKRFYDLGPWVLYHKRNMDILCHLFTANAPPTLGMVETLLTQIL
jgi:hypothetical protein